MPIQKSTAVEPRPKIQKLKEAIDLRIGGAHVPFEVIKVRDKDGCKLVHVYAHIPAEDGDSDSSDTESDSRTRIEISLVTDKWWKDVAGEIIYVADGNCDDGGKVISVLLCLVDPEDEVEQDEEEFVKAFYELEPENADFL
ncbi:uncharacterized protein ColSpa_09211 [Colletotrichum spaethianum]|uniref:Uncharacterized protein n=1 Tax=Colletotrichum spaethianum TaxID=700344 RepID=A0AA37PBB4_9PEZI|nr:uncharacterized protein ColSpa_09211 [Colletotrichum spaethianum]GKT49030.1 hypothetical protein ColSpa_09211 [Colletotrichum spaethianum]